MNTVQMVVYGLEGRLLEGLQVLARTRGIWLREVRHVKTCLSVLRQAGPTGIVVLKVGSDLEKELSLLARVTKFFPQTTSIVVGNAENFALAGLAWDLGASFVLFPPEPLDKLPGVVEGFLPRDVLPTQPAPPSR